MVAFPKPRAFSLCHQMLSLKKAFPDSECRVRRNRLRWRARLSPSPLSETYTLRLEYSLERPPIVRVESPALCEPLGAELPHVYSDGSLCLYYPRGGEFARDRLLVHTIVPWASEWLYHYELWHVTGEWLGGGIHPGDSQPICN